MYPTSFPGLGHGRRAVSGAGSVTAADVGLILDCSGTFALTFAAAATLGNQFQVAFYVSSGTVTLTGSGAETIQSPSGSANTFVLTAGQGAYVSCNGTGLEIVLGVGLAPAPATTITTDTIQAATTAGIVLKNSSGTQVASFGLTGTGVIFAGAVTANGGTLTAGTADINGGAIDGTAIGASSRSTGAFTTLAANSTATFTGNITQTGSTTFSTGTGNVSLNGAVNCSSMLTVSGVITAHNGTNGDITTKRATTSGFGQFKTLTGASTYEWSWGTRSGDSDFYLRNEQTATNVMQVTGATVNILGTADGILTVAGKITAKVAVPGSFASFADVQSYLASILT